MAPTVGVMDAAWRRPPACQSGAQSCERQGRVEPSGQGVADDLAAAGIENDGEVTEAGGNSDVCEVRNPDHVRPIRDLIAVEGRGDRRCAPRIQR